MDSCGTVSGGGVLTNIGYKLSIATKRIALAVVIFIIILIAVGQDWIGDGWLGLAIPGFVISLILLLLALYGGHKYRQARLAVDIGGMFATL